MTTKRIFLTVGAVLALLLILFFNPFTINDAGNRQVIQSFTGDLSVRFEPGFYFSGFRAKVTTYPNNVTIQVGPESKRSEEADYWAPAHTATFGEGDKAEAGHTVKWDLPNSSDQMIALHQTYRTIDNLMKTTLLQYQKEVMTYSTQRLSSEAHYSGGQSQLKDYFQDQLRYGQVLLNTETKTRKLENGTEKTYIVVEERRDSLGKIIRTTSDIQTYGLTASFVSIDHIQYDDRIYEKLKAKIDAAADEATSKQKVYYSTTRSVNCRRAGEAVVS
jgi:DNA-binding protein H-NS